MANDPPPKKLTKQEKTVLAQMESIETYSFLKEHGFRRWAYEVIRGGGVRHPWPKYFELTDFFGDKRHGDSVPRNYKAFLRLPKDDRVVGGALFALGAWTFLGPMLYCYNSTFWFDSIQNKWGFQQAYTREHRALHGNRPEIY